MNFVEILFFAVLFALIGVVISYGIWVGNRYPYIPAPKDKRCTSIAPGGKRRCWLETGHEKKCIKHFERNRFTEW